MADYRKQIPFIRKWEGGLSNDTRDSASAHPAPCVYRGQSGWHTNKGITYASFSSNANQLRYDASCETFFAMPDFVWRKIYKHSYWDKFYLDQLHSQAMADLIVSMAWGSGVGGAYKQLAKFFNTNYGTNFPATTSSYSVERANEIKNLINQLTRTAKKEQRLYQQFLEHYRQFYISLNNPVFINGWLNRLDALNEFTYASLRAVARSGKFFLWLGISGLAALTALGIYAITTESQRTNKRLATPKHIKKQYHEHD